MKRIIGLFLVLLNFYPSIVKANIVCNDGTISPSCSTCHSGCCSKHGGCSSNSSGSSSSSSNKKPDVIEDVKSNDTSLKKVNVDGENIAISNNMEYTTTKENVTVLVVANDSKATLDYNQNNNLVIGENDIYIKVTAENGNINNYKLNIIREKILSNNKNIKIFVAEKEIIFNLFKSDVINISNEENKIDITYELEDSNAKVDIMGNENLQVGYNEIIVKVTAENGEEQDYILVVEKEEKANKKEDKADIQDEIIEEENTNENASNIFVILCSLALIGGTSYLIYKEIKKKKANSQN